VVTGEVVGRVVVAVEVVFVQPARLNNIIAAIIVKNTFFILVTSLTG
jgi:hypothetical protein